MPAFSSNTLIMETYLTIERKHNLAQPLFPVENGYITVPTSSARESARTLRSLSGTGSAGAMANTSPQLLSRRNPLRLSR